MIDLLAASRLRQWLAPGGSPLHWQQQFADDAAWLLTWPPDTEWVGLITQPTLLERPLLGDALSELTGLLPETAVPEPESPPSQPVVSHPEARNRRTRSTKRRSTHSRDHHSVPRSTVLKNDHQQTHVEQLPNQANRSLLHQLAPEGVPTPNKAISSSTVRQTNLAVTRKKSTASPPVGGTAVTRSYFQTLTKRMSRVLPSLDKAAVSTKLNDSATARESQNKNEHALLEVAAGIEPWLQSVTGPTATPALLQQNLLAAKSNGRIRSSSNANDSGQNNPPGFNQTDYSHALSLTKLTKHQDMTAASRQMPDREASQTAVNKSKPDMVTSNMRNDQSRLMQTIANKLGLPQTTVDKPDRLAPPQKAETLPILDPTPDAPEAPFSPATAVFDRRQKEAERHEVVEPDLQSLSTSIKRILDEEARRFGIDV